MSFSLRAMLAFSSATRSRYFWWLRCSGPSFSGSPLLYSLASSTWRRFGLLQLGLEDGARIGVAGTLRASASTRCAEGDCGAAATLTAALALTRVPSTTVMLPPSMGLQPLARASTALLVYTLPTQR